MMGFFTSSLQGRCLALRLILGVPGKAISVSRPHHFVCLQNRSARPSFFAGPGRDGVVVVIARGEGAPARFAGPDRCEGGGNPW